MSVMDGYLREMPAKRGDAGRGWGGNWVLGILVSGESELFYNFFYLLLHG